MKKTLAIILLCLAGTAHAYSYSTGKNDSTVKNDDANSLTLREKTQLCELTRNSVFFVQNSRNQAIKNGEYLNPKDMMSQFRQGLAALKNEPADNQRWFTVTFDLAIRFAFANLPTQSARQVTEEFHARCLRWVEGE